MRLYYVYLGKLLSFGYDVFQGSDESYVKIEDLDGVVGKNFNFELKDEMFISNCSMGSDEAHGRFLVYNNKICVKERNDVVLNHEIVHYALWNLPMYKKIIMREKIIKLIYDIKKSLPILDSVKLKSDDYVFYNYLKNTVDFYANEPEYSFYQTLQKYIITFRGNEEYVTYGVGEILMMTDSGFLYVYSYQLENPLLKKIYEQYKDIYSQIIETGKEKESLVEQIVN